MCAGRTALIACCLVAMGAAAFVREKALVRERLDLKPRPDALEYALGARSFAESGRFELELGGAHYPLRYPPGFPAIAAPYVAAAGGDASAAWRASLAHGVAAVPMSALLGHFAGGLPGACCAALLAIVSPLSIENSGLAMSETSSELLWALALLCLCVGASPRERPRGALPFSLAGVAIGLALTIRYTNLALVAPALLFAVTLHRFRPERAGKAALALLAPVAIFGALLLLYQWRTFGEPLADGYPFWVPEVYKNPDLVFSPRYLSAGIPGYWERGHLETYGDVLLGFDRRIWATPWLAALAAVGVVRTLWLARTSAVHRMLALAILVALPAVVVFHLFYFWQDPRFFVPLVPCFAAMCASGGGAIVDVANRAGARAGKLAGGAVVAGAAAALVAVSGMARPWFETPAGPHREAPTPPALVERLAGLDRDLPRGSIVIVDFPVTIAEPALGVDREIMVSDADTADPHLNAIARHDLRGFDGTKPSTRFLAQGGRATRSTIDAVLRAVDERRDVFFLEVTGEGAAGAGIAELRASTRFDEAIARPPVTVWRITSRRE